MSLILKISQYSGDVIKSSLFLKVSNPTGTEITEYRELALGNVEGKLFFSMVSNRLTKHIVDKFKFVNTSVQKGCMKNIPGCWEHMASVWEALSDAKLNKKNVATVWLDLANAYGTIPHNLILFALERYQVDNKLFNMNSPHNDNYNQPISLQRVHAL